MVVIDVLRGIFLFAIVVNHLQLFPNIFVFFTGGTALWVSFASGFFAVSGLVFAYIYKSYQSSFTSLIKKSWGRALKLYLWTISLTTFFTLWSNTGPKIFEKNALWEITSQNWKDLLLNTLTFKYVYGWHDFLPYYVLFLLFAPFVLLGFKKLGTKIMLVFSLFVWLLRGTNTYLAQQIIFIGGMALGFNYHYLEDRYSSLNKKKKMLIIRFFYFSFITTLVACLLSVFLFKDVLMYLKMFGYISSSTQEFLLSKNSVLNLYFDKGLLNAGRLILAPIWHGALFIFVSKHLDDFANIFGGLFPRWGKNSLFVYLIHSIVVFAFPAVVVLFGQRDFIANTVLTALAIIAVNFIVDKKIRLYKNKTIFD